MFKRALLLLCISLPSFGAVIETKNLVATRGGGSQLVIPAAGSLAGANGTYFRSEINLINYTNRTQRVQLQWLPQGFPPEAFPTVTISINPMSGISSEDFVPDLLHVSSGLGAILVTGVTANDNMDATARLYASDRIWTNQPGSSGTVSQTFNVMLTLDLTGSSSVSIIGLRRDSQYRLNIGIVNLASTPQKFQVATNGGDTASLTVPGLSSQQFVLPGSTPNLQVIVSNVTDSATRSPNWVAFGSSVDNVTGDSWSMLGFVPNIDIAGP
jgi:hypothetical protein